MDTNVKLPVIVRVVVDIIAVTMAVVILTGDVWGSKKIRRNSPAKCFAGFFYKQFFYAAFLMPDFMSRTYLRNSSIETNVPSRFWADQ